MLFGLGGCWKLDPAALPDGPVAFAPEAGGPDGWVVESIDLPIRCPDDEDARLYIVRPEALDGPAPLALLLHSGAFDYVNNPEAGNPLAGNAFQDPPRLGLDWSIQRVFFLLGMVPDDDSAEDSTGALPAALAERGVTMLVPTNCWGDWWHNLQSLQENNFTADGFYRNGLFAADFSQRAARSPDFAATNGVDLTPVQSNGTMLLIGIGEGGRGVTELVGGNALSPDSPTGILLDSPVDDMTKFWTNPDPSVYAATLVGLNRIFIGGATDASRNSLVTSPVIPQRTALVYSSVDPNVPAGANDAAAARTAAVGGLVRDGNTPDHALTTANPILAGEVADFLLGIAPE